MARQLMGAMLRHVGSCALTAATDAIALFHAIRTRSDAPRIVRSDWVSACRWLRAARHLRLLRPAARLASPNPCFMAPQPTSQPWQPIAKSG